MKYCRGCERERPVSVFHRDPGHSDGLKTRCKDCNAKTQAKWRAKSKGVPRPKRPTKIDPERIVFTESDRMFIEKCRAGTQQKEKTK